MKLDGASVLITGASGGIGNAIARALVGRGASVKLSARRVDVLEQLRDELGAAAETIPADLADAASVRELIQRAGEVDVLVANAGLPGSGTVDSFSVEQIDRLLDVNLRAPIVLAHALLPGMLERRRGQIVLISSLAGKASSSSSSLYSATKFGLRGFALGLREDLHGSGVGVTTVFPGFIRDAGMFAESGAKLPSGVGTRTPDDVARAVVKAIESDPAEIDVAPVALRAGAAFAGLAPELAMKVSRRLGSGSIGEQISSGQADKR